MTHYTILVEYGSDVDIDSEEGYRALMCCVLSGNVTAVSNLITKGIDLNKKNNENQPLLILAAMSNMIEVVMFLLKNGADYGVKDRYGKTIFDYLDSKEEKKIKQFIDSQKQEKLILAARNKDMHAVMELVGDGVDINAQDPWGQTALDYLDPEQAQIAKQKANDISKNYERPNIVESMHQLTREINEDKKTTANKENKGPSLR